jgi:peroxiredoxin
VDLAGARVDHAHMMRYWVLPDQIHNYAHNNEWLIRDLNLVGRAHDAVNLAKNMIELPRHPRFNTLDKRGGSASFGRSRLLDTLVRYELWDDLFALDRSGYITAGGSTAEEIKRITTLGLAHFHKGNLDRLRDQLFALELLAKNEKPATNPPAASRREPDGEQKESYESKPDSPERRPAPVASPRGRTTEGKRKGPPPRRPSESALAELRGLVALSEGRTNEARKQFALALDAPKDRLAPLYLRLGDKPKAEQLAADAVRGSTNEVPVLARYVEVLYRAGKTNEAKANFALLRKISGHLDRDLPITTRLGDIAVALGLPRMWQLLAPRQTDVGQRPSLDSLGPYRWSPPHAPDWTLPTADGKKISLADYRGRPVIVIFYLGNGCLHCIQQLQAFAPMAAEFKQAGLALVAVSKDSPAGLKLSLDKLKPEGGFPFPLVSDETLGVFKRYRCFDDFEQTALHGTFLLDGDGAVRWLDINYQPFMDAKFLLGEARRLLSLPKLKLSHGTSARVAAVVE